jgi:hypothetical protein
LLCCSDPAAAEEDAAAPPSCGAEKTPLTSYSFGLRRAAWEIDSRHKSPSPGSKWVVEHTFSFQTPASVLLSYSTLVLWNGLDIQLRETIVKSVTR